MKKKLLATILAAAMVASMAACGKKEEAPAAPAETEAPAEAPAETEAPAEAPAESGETVKVILVTMDGLDNHWVNVDKGASAAAAELGID